MVLNRLGWLSVRHSKAVLACTVLAVVLAGVIGSGVVPSLTAGGFVPAGAQSQRARTTLLAGFEQGAPNLTLLVTAKEGTVDSPAVAADGARVAARLAREPGVEQVWSYWPGSVRPLRSRDSRQGLVLARIGGNDDEVQRVVKRLSPAFTTSDAATAVGVGGTAEVAREAQTQIRADLQRAETMSIPVLLCLLLLVFGSWVAAGLPLVMGLISIVGTLLVLRLLVAMTDVSLFALNLTTALGLGLAIDYSLFIVARYREERGRGLQHPDAVVRSVETAGRTVVFSATTVAVSLSALLVFPTVFLRSFAYAGAAVVALSAVTALVVLPALLALVGPRIERWTLPRSRTARAHHKLSRPGAWERLAVRVMRRPLLTGGTVLALLLVLGLPMLGAKPGLPDYRSLPTSATSRQVQESIDAGFARGEGNGLVVVSAPGARVPDAAGLTAYATALSRLDGVARVDSTTGSYAAGRRVAPAVDRGAEYRNGQGTWFSVVPSIEPLSPAGELLVKQVRALPAPVPMQVGGPSAELVDTKQALFSRLPVALGLVGAVSFVVLFLFTGGVVVAAKAIVLNLLSLSATFGAMVWVFQEGHLSGLLNFTATGTLDTNMPILLFCVVFGLSMDYEVFLLSRIKEAYDLTGDNRKAIATGLGSTGRLVSAAAMLLAVVFIAFATSGISFIKLLGIGTALAVVTDATLVRGVLVPAFMRLAGDANWWAPAPLRRLHARLGLEDGPVLPELAEASPWTSAQDAPVVGGRPPQSGPAGTAR